MKTLLLLIIGLALCGNDPDPDERPRLARDIGTKLYVLLLPLSLIAATILLFVMVCYSWLTDPFPARVFLVLGIISLVLFILTSIKIIKKSSF